MLWYGKLLPDVHRSPLNYSLKLYITCHAAALTLMHDQSHTALLQRAAVS